MAIDPACSTRPGADSSAIVIISSDGQYYRCHATWNAQVTAPDLIRQIEILNQRWNPDCIVYESNGGFAALGQILASIPSIQTRLVQVHQSKTKQARVNALATFVENGTFRIRLPEQTLLYQQMTEFPLGEHDDLVDAAATAVLESHRRKAHPRIWS
ncbi:MAG: hypothetical protein ACRCZF_00965 [Gemmataceae bacterium]